MIGSVVTRVRNNADAAPREPGCQLLKLHTYAGEHLTEPSEKVR